MKAFVTGGTGFVGSHLVEALLAGGEEVRCLVRQDRKWLANLPVAFVKGDLFDGEALREGMTGVDVVYHVAGLTRAPKKAALDRANVEGTRQILDAAKAAGVGKVLVTSSLAATGPSGSLPLTESAPLVPLSDYGRSKAEMERHIAERTSGPSVVVVRPPAVYGPREADIFNLIKAADKFRVLPIVGNGIAPQLDLVHVRDLVSGMIAAAESNVTAGQTYFLGGMRGYSWDEIRKAIRGAVGREALNINIPRVLMEPLGLASEGIGRMLGKYPALNREKAREGKAAWLVSSEKARTDFGYQPSVSLEEGMRETVRWYRENGWL